MDEFVWLNSSLTETTPLNSAYYAAKTDLTGGAELFTSLNYNFNANYETIDFTNIISEALIDSNIYKNRVELTGNLNFSDLITLTNTDIKTLILKNKNIANDFGISFENNNNRFINIDGYKSITNLEFKNTPGEIKIKNCDSIINKLNFSNVNSVDLKNILINVNQDIHFNTINNLNIKNATIIATTNNNQYVRMFDLIGNGNFDNVSFRINAANTPCNLFNHVTNSTTRYYNNINFNKCCFSDNNTDIYFNGINANCKNCTFIKMIFNNINSFNITCDKMQGYSQKTFTFYLSNSYNTINITNSATYNYVLSSPNISNRINFKNEYYGIGNVSINEFPFNTPSATMKNTYYFENDKTNLDLNIYYGNTTATLQGRNPEIHLGKNHNKLIINNIKNLHYNIFDIYFEDVFNETNLEVSEFRDKLTTTPTTATNMWNVGNFNLFNLHFMKDSKFDSAFSDRILSLFGGDMSTYIKNSFFTDWVKFYDAAGHQITSFN